MNTKLMTNGLDIKLALIAIFAVLAFKGYYFMITPLFVTIWSIMFLNRKTGRGI